jgi:hypothetical protein
LRREWLPFAQKCIPFTLSGQLVFRKICEKKLSLERT